MGCASSKNVGATVALDVYRPAPSSFAVFDINSIEEPWLKHEEANENQKKPSHVPARILDKLDNDSEAAPPRTWEEISKALKEVKNQPAETTKNDPQEDEEEEEDYTHENYRSVPRKSSSFHTLAELEAKLNPKPTPSSSSNRNTTSSSTSINNKQQQQERTPQSTTASTHLRKTASSSSLTTPPPKKTTTTEDASSAPPPKAVVFGADSGEGFRSVKDNPFVIMDRTQKEGGGTNNNNNNKNNWVVRRDPFADYPEICPPRGAQSVVLYTTSLRGVRKTFEDCSRARTVLEIQRVVFDERDVSLHAEFLSELRELLVDQESGGVSVPRIFIHGRYIGGADQLVELNESGRLGRMLTWARVERGVGWHGCEGCGGARFVPCFDCGGSCKLVLEGGGDKQRCPKCNENGLLHCPLCH